LVKIDKEGSLQTLLSAMLKDNKKRYPPANGYLSNNEKKAHQASTKQFKNFLSPSLTFPKNNLS
jgi:hypothetical protein